jgi:hypothetical protein
MVPQKYGVHHGAVGKDVGNGSRGKSRHIGTCESVVAKYIDEVSDGEDSDELTGGCVPERGALHV